MSTPPQPPLPVSDPSDEANTPNMRRLFLFFGGMMGLGLLLSLLLFGGEFWTAGQTVADPETASSADFVFELAEMPPEARIGNIEIGQQAPDFVLQNINGETVTLTDYEGQVVILNFWATWCAPCRAEMPELEVAYQAYQEQGLAILALNREENPTTIAAFWEQMASQGTPLSFVSLMDETGAVADRYGVFNMPTTYFIAPSGEITAVHRGLLTHDLIESYLAPILPSS